MGTKGSKHLTLKRRRLLHQLATKSISLSLPLKQFVWINRSRPTFTKSWYFNPYLTLPLILSHDRFVISLRTSLTQTYQYKRVAEEALTVAAIPFNPKDAEHQNQLQVRQSQGSLSPDLILILSVARVYGADWRVRRMLVDTRIGQISDSNRPITPQLISEEWVSWDFNSCYFSPNTSRRARKVASVIPAIQPKATLSQSRESICLTWLLIWW